MVATVTGEKTPHSVPPCHELDPPYNIKLVFVQKITSVLRKINKNRCRQSCTFSLQYAPTRLPAQLGELTALPQTPSCI